ncbi:TMEM199/VMA12 family protein [Aspergillus saccharolyticus JOP 1030-1]|uniref:Endoplasmic reticulum-based factor for assembly of V-ATPase n=1 Tax=Aspergillus saccharolyticus JOP 1030-1 TaxID=1450539 RepID=A0A318ZJV7_9EURO|nr:hypothetical protein BP01DRAFT_395759 [Aspergillus saccharolyticus JOP 1030-1]PYH40548.1 hypothetical protein BP01DRAFT_395759 [Aspergillus saccharolyticus JOP 1030-1]
MVNLITTPAILSAYEALPASTRQDLSLPSALHLTDPISHEQLIGIARFFRNCSPPPPPPQNDTLPQEQRSLNALLRGTKLHVPPPPPKPEPTKEYLAYKRALLAAAEADAYTRMTTPQPFFSASAASSSSPGATTLPPSAPNPIFTSSSPQLAALHDRHSSSSSGSGGLGRRPPHDDDQETITPSLVLNIFLSVLITGFSVFWALHSWLPAGTVRVGAGVKVLLSLGAALGVAVVEAGIYAIYLQKVRVAREKERRVREVKVVVGREVVGGKKDGEGVVVGGGAGVKEEIWGKGEKLITEKVLEHEAQLTLENTSNYPKDR